METKLIDSKQTATLLNRKVTTLYDWVNDGVVPFPYTKVKQRLLFNEKDVLDYLKSNTITPN